MRKAAVLLIPDNQEESFPESFTFNGISSTDLLFPVGM